MLTGGAVHADVSAFNGGKSPLADCEIITAERIEELVKTDELLPPVEASVYLAGN